MARWTGLIGLALRAHLAGRIASLSNHRQWAKRAGDTQKAQLRHLITRAKRTSFGREHAFARLHSVKDADLLRAWRQEVAPHSYEDLLPLLRRMREEAEPDVTWPGVIRNWAQTSGTTSGDKFVPVSKELFRHNYKAGLDVYAHAARFGCSLPSIWSGKILFMGGSTDVKTSEKGVRTGDLSGVIIRKIRYPITASMLPDLETGLMSHWPSKIDKMAHTCLDEDVRWISGMPSWTLALIDRMFEVAREQGRQPETLRDIWPNLRVFIHGGVRYEPFERRFREVWSGSPTGADLPTRIEVYPASEGFIAIQDTPHDPGLRLNIDHGVFYEFIPLEQIGDENPPAFACDEVEPGQRYVVVMSTCAGLWRYMIGDVVEFDTIPPDGPPRLRIVGRQRLFINAFGENLIVEHIENAVIEATDAVAAPVGEFIAAPIYPDPKRHQRAGLELAIEWKNPATDEDGRLDRFRKVFDASLKKQNVDYTTKRTDDLGMAPPVITALPSGAIHNWMQSKGKLGGQHKCPRCANNRMMIDEVLAMSGVSSPQQRRPGERTD